MKEDELNIEQILYEDAQSIAIDEAFKNDLKSKFMSLEKPNNVVNLPKRNNQLTHNKYLRIASGFAICVLVGGTWIKINDMNVVDKNRRLIPNEQKISTISNTKDYSGGNKKPNINPGNLAIGITDKSKVNAERTDKVIDEHTDKVIDEHTDKVIDEHTRKNVKVNEKDISKISSISSEKDNTRKTEEAKGGTDIVVDKNKGKSNIKDITKNNYEMTDEQINEKISEKTKNASIRINTKLPINNTSIVDLVQEVQNCYDSRYSVDGNSLAIIKNDGLYIKTLKTSEMVKILDNGNYIINKPNFTQDGRIVYYKVEKPVTGQSNFDEKNGAIYISKLDGSSSEKLIDGKNPMISKDGCKLTYETQGKIYIMNLSTKSKLYVDDGKYPAWSENSNMLSYVKENKEKQIYDKVTEKKDLYIEKIYSTIWIYSLESGNKLNLDNEIIDVNNKNLQSWADAVRSGEETSNFDIHGKYAYYESIWSNTNKELFVIRRDNEVETYELIKYNIGDSLK